MCSRPASVVTVTGQDAPGIAAALFDVLERAAVEVRDVEQVRVHGRLLLCVEVAGGPDHLAEEIARACGDQVHVAVEELTEHEPAGGERFLVTVLAPSLGAADLSAIGGTVATAGGNIERIVRLSEYPVISYELTVAGGDLTALRAALAEVAVQRHVDVAVQMAGLHRRAKHLIVLDADSTLLQGEVIDALAARHGCADAVSGVTAAAMAGELDFEDALRRRVRLLAGMPSSAVDDVRRSLTLTPGARTLVRTLKRLGYHIAVVSGGFTQVIAGLVSDIGVDHLAANVLDVRDGRLTGELLGPVVDRAGKAAALVRFAADAGVPLSQTIAVGDGANDLDMLSVAGLGIAFNAKPLVRQAADTALSVPYLDAILFLLGISRREVERADRLDEVGSA